MTFLKLVGCKMLSRKLLKLNDTPESLPTAWELKNKIKKRQALQIK